MVAGMRTAIALLAFCAWSGDVETAEPVDDPPEDPACAVDPAAPRFDSDELGWDLERDLDSDRPVCSEAAPACDRIDAMDAPEDDDFDVDGMALDHEPDAISYALADPLT